MRCSSLPSRRSTCGGQDGVHAPGFFRYERMFVMTHMIPPTSDDTFWWAQVPLSRHVSAVQASPSSHPPGQARGGSVDDVVVGLLPPRPTGRETLQAGRSAIARQPVGPPDNRPVQRHVTPGVHPPPRSHTPVACVASRQSVSAEQILYWIGSVPSHHPSVPWIPRARMRQTSDPSSNPSTLKSSSRSPSITQAVD